MNPQAQPDPQAVAAAVAAMTIPIMIGSVIGLLVLIFFILTLSKALSRVSERNREMSPGAVWLMLIPCFGFIWEFVVIIRLASSLKKEFIERGIHSEGESYGQGLGIASVILRIFCGPVGVICWIIYWVKIAGFSARLAEGGGSSGGGDGYKERDRDYR
jgi:uncharacterized membrane protein YgcG